MPLLNVADKIYLGTAEVDKLYLAGKQVWPPPAPPTGFTPDDLSGLAIWLDAANFGDYSEITGTAWWANGAPDGATPVFVGSPQPSVSETALNGMPVVRFKPNEGRLRIQSGSGVNLEWTLVYVGRMVGPNAGRIVDAIYSPNNLLVGYWNGFQDVMYDAGFTVPNTQTPWTNHWKTYSGDGTTGLSRLFSDGVLMGSATTAAGWGGTFAISGYGATGTEETCDCEVAEVVMYNRKLSDEDRQQVEAYLFDKWFVEHTVEPTFSPLDVPGMLTWLDATQMTGKSDGDLVPSWTDASGNAFPATAYAGNVVYHTDGINGHPAMRFGEYGSVVESRVAHGRTIADRTIFQVVKIPLGGQFGSYATTQLQGNDPYLQTYSTGNVIHTYTNPDLSSGVTWSGVGQLITVWCEAATGTQGVKVDATEVTGSWSPSSSNAWLQLGANAVASYGMNGWIGEVIYYDRCLTAIERADIQEYLAEKWSLT